MRFRFCPECGNQLSSRVLGDEGEVPWCEKCNRPWFDMFSTCVICLVVSESGKICLLRQYNIDHHVFVAGYIKDGECAEKTAMREVAEETGLSVISAGFLKSFFYEKRDQLMLGFLVRVKDGELNISSEVDEAGWFDFDEAVKAVRGASICDKLLAEYKTGAIK